MSNSTKYLLFFLIVASINIFIKFYGIDKNSLWIDEAYSINEAQQSVQTIIVNSSYSDNPPLYYILLHYWTNLFGISEFAVRSLSAFLSTVAACLMFVFVSRHFNLITGFISTLFFSVSNENLFYAQETRTYALVVFLTVVSIGLFFELFKKNNYLFLVLFTISNILLIYSHYISFLIPLLESGIAILYVKKNKKFCIAIILSTLLVVISFLPWIQYPLSHSPKDGSFWLKKPTFSNLKGVLIGIAGNKLTLVLCFLILVFSLYLKLKAKKRFDNFISFEELSLLTFTFFPIIFVFIISGFIPIFLLRYLLFASVPFYILFPFLLDTNIKNKNIFLFASIALIVCSMVSIKLHASKDENWKGAIEKVKSIRGNGEAIILSASYTDLIFSYYYDKKIFKENGRRDTLLYNELIYPINSKSLDKLVELKKQESLIGVYCHELMEDPSNKIVQELASVYNDVETYNFDKVRVVVYRNLIK